MDSGQPPQPAYRGSPDMSRWFRKRLSDLGDRIYAQGSERDKMLVAGGGDRVLTCSIAVWRPSLDLTPERAHLTYVETCQALAEWRQRKLLGMKGKGSARFWGLLGRRDCAVSSRNSGMQANRERWNKYVAFI